MKELIHTLKIHKRYFSHTKKEVHHLISLTCLSFPSAYMKNGTGYTSQNNQNSTWNRKYDFKRFYVKLTQLELQVSSQNCYLEQTSAEAL